MNSIIKYFINRSFVVNLISVFIILAGVLLGSMSKRDMIPPFEFKSAVVRISLPGASATEVEKYLTFPVEQALQGLPHSKEIESVASAGKLKTEIFFNAGHDEMAESVEDIRSRINTILWQLPEQSRDIQVEQNKVTSVFLMGISLENFDENVLEHRRYSKRIRDQLRAVPGVLRVFKDMHDSNVYIKIDPEKIAQNEISIDEVRRRVSQSLNYSPIGQVDFNEKRFTVEIERPTEAIENLNRLAIRGNTTGDTLYLEDIAEVSLDIDEIKTINRYNGNPTINFYMRKDVASDAISLKKKITKILETENANLPAGMKAHIFFDQPKFIENQLDTLQSNGLFGMILVLLILTLFFNWKVSLATSFGIPIAYCGTLVALYAYGISINMVSVVGMILVLGILVDDAIIIAERYMENLEKGMKPKEAAFAASQDLMIPVTGTVLTTVFAFSPMILIDSEIAIIFYAIPVVIIVSLAMSWLESFFILPNHLYHFIKTPPKEGINTKLFEKVKTAYQNGLARILRFRYLVVLALIGFFAVSVWVAKNKIQQEWWFGGNQVRIAVKVFLKENISLDYTEKRVKPLEDYLLSLPKDKFQTVSTSIGDMWTHGRYYNGYRYAKIMLHINEDITHPGKIQSEYTDKLKKYFEDYTKQHPEFEKIVVGFEANDEDDKKKQMVSIDVIGNEDVEFLTLKQTLEKQLSADKMPLKLIEDANEFDEKWIFKPDTKKLARYQMSLASITNQLRSFFVPHELTQIRINGETKWIYTQVKRQKTISKEELNQMPVLNNLGLPVPLYNLGSWSKKTQLSRITHKDGKRKFTFDLEFEPSDTMNIVKAQEIGKGIAKTMAAQFPTYKIDLVDADRAEASSRAWALKVALLCIVLVMFTLALVLNSLTLPLLVGLPIPFGLMGIVWALFLHDMKMGIMSLIGLVGTVGVSVNDSLIMVDQIMKRGRAVGELTRQHILEGASSRLRAIILTTVTTLGGVFPMAYGIGGESGFTQPLAFSLGWGLLFSTFLTLFALPAFIEVRRDVGKLTKKLMKKFKGDSSGGGPNKSGQTQQPIIKPQIDESFVARPSDRPDLQL